MTRPQPTTARIFATAEEEEQGQEEEGKEMSDFKQSSELLVQQTCNTEMRGVFLMIPFF